MSSKLQIFNENQVGLYGLIEHSCNEIPVNISHRKMNKLHAYHRIIRKLDKLMEKTISSNNRLEVSILYWKFLEEFEKWIISFHDFQFFLYFKIIFTSMFITLLDNVIMTFPEMEKSFKCIDNYPHVKRCI